MFNQYNNVEKDYEIEFCDKTIKEFTAQQLYEFYLFNVPDLALNFDDVKSKLDNGEKFVTGDYDWDWTIPSYKGEMTIRKKLNKVFVAKTNTKSTSSECDHKNKYINQAGTVKFWVCPACKKDLGDAK